MSIVSVLRQQVSGTWTEVCLSSCWRWQVEGLHARLCWRSGSLRVAVRGRVSLCPHCAGGHGGTWCQDGALQGRSCRADLRCCVMLHCCDQVAAVHDCAYGCQLFAVELQGPEDLETVTAALTLFGPPAGSQLLAALELCDVVVLGTLLAHGGHGRKC